MVMTPPYHPIAKKAATLLDCPAVEGQLRAQASICRKRDILLAKYICQHPFPRHNNFFQEASSLQENRVNATFPVVWVTLAFK